MYQNGTNRVDARAYNSAGLGRMMASEAPLERARFKLSYGYKYSFFVIPANWTIFACYDTCVLYIILNRSIIQKYRPEVGVQGCDIARGPQAQGLYHIRGHPPKVYIFCILTGFSMLYRIYFIMMTAFLNGRYIYKNINPTTSNDDVIIIYNKHKILSTLLIIKLLGCNLLSPCFLCEVNY